MHDTQVSGRLIPGTSTPAGVEVVIDLREFL